MLKPLFIFVKYKSGIKKTSTARGTEQNKTSPGKMSN
jgi:hypothetical protein